MLPICFAGPLALDEHGSYWIMDSDLPGSLLHRSLGYAAIPPLSSWIQAGSVFLFGKSEFVFRLPSAVCFLGTIAVVWQLGKQLHSAECGALCALLMAWHPEAMDEVRIARCYGLVLLLSSVLLLITLRWQRSLMSFRWAPAWSLSAVMLLWTHYTSALLIISCAGVLIAACLARRRKARPAALRLLVGFVPVLIGSYPLFESVQRLSEWGPYLNFSPDSPSLSSKVGAFWWAGIPTGIAVCLLLNWFPEVTAAAPQKISPDHKSRRWDLLLLLACSVLPIVVLTVLASGPMSSLANPRYRTAYAPATVCLFALITTLISPFRISTIAAAAALCIAWILTPLLPWQTGRLGAPADDDWYLLNSHLAVNATAGDPILVQGGLAEAHLVPLYVNDPVFMEYVACRVSRFYVEKKHRRYALPSVWRGNLNVTRHFQGLLNDWKNTSQEFWLACATDTDLNRESHLGLQQLAVETGFDIVELHVWPNAVLQRFSSRPDQTPVNSAAHVEMVQ